MSVARAIVREDFAKHAWIIVLMVVLVVGRASPSVADEAAAVDRWLAENAITFSIDAPDRVDGAVDEMMAAIGQSVRLLGFGEALHGAEDILLLRNRVFQRLVEAHGFSAIAIESGFPEGHVVNDYVSGGEVPYAQVAETGFSWSFGGLEANRELVDWMRSYNADPSHAVKLRFYGFDISAIGGARIHGPDRVLDFAVDYLSSIDSVRGQMHRETIEPLLGALSGWEDPRVFTREIEGPGLQPAAETLRIATEDLITELRTRRPELVAKSGEARYLQALQFARVARRTLAFHVAAARTPKEPPAGLRGVRDALMADNLMYIVEREADRGKVFVFAHNGHLQRGKSVWPCCGQKFMGTDVYEWWPAGAQVNEMLGSGYVIVGSGVGSSDPVNGVGYPEAGTLEARLANLDGNALFIPTRSNDKTFERGVDLLPVRTASEKNLTYTTLTPESLTAFDWWHFLDVVGHTRPISAESGSGSQDGNEGS